MALTPSFYKTMHHAFFDGTLLGPLGRITTFLKPRSKQKRENKRGSVFLVGAGAGTAELLTLKAAALLKAADVVVYDRLVDPSVLELAGNKTKLIYVGKAPGAPCLKQETINEILIREALAGFSVVRLKCGDPLIFGRAGEEMAVLSNAGIYFEIVPGITAASAAAAAAKMPLTEREGVRSLIFLTGHSTEGLTPYDWSGLAQEGALLVLYMGVKMAPRIEANLLAVGVRAGAPVTIIENGARDNARKFETTLGRISQIMKMENIKNPTMIYIRVVRQSHPILEKGRVATLNGELV